MKSSTARWTTALAAAACLATPTVGWSQTPPASQPPASQQQPAPKQQPSTQQPSSSTTGQSGEAQEHLRQAQAALNDVPASVPARAKSKIAELKRRLNTLEKSSAAGHAQGSASAQASKTTAPSKNSWSTEVAAIDKIITELLGPATGSGASEPTGTTGATGATGSKSRSTTTMTLDETTKSKLIEVRTHVTAYAAAMSGTSTGAKDAPAPEPTTAEPAAAAEPTPTTSQPAAQQPTTAQQPTSQNPAGEQPQQAASATGQQADAEASKRHLTAARESLSQLTQLPAAAQLTGEPRTQVSQLITNFNELITTKENWRAAYDKVAANVNSLVGPETAEQPQAQNPAAPGAVGTSGTTAATLDPAIRAKLVEFRNHLKQFESAAGGSGDQPGASAAGAPASSSSSMNSTTGQPSSPMTAQSTSPTTAQSTSPTTGQSTSPTTGSTGGQSTAGTTGATSPSAEQQPASAMGQDSAVQHIDAIEAILNGRSSSSSTGATTGNAPTATTGAATTGSITLNQSQLEEIRTHLAELRKAVKK